MARGYTKLEGYIAEMGNCDLEVLAGQPDVGDISDVERFPTSKHGSWGIELILLEAPRQI